MPVTLNKPMLWSYAEASRLFGLAGEDGPRTIRTLVKAHKLEPKPMDHPVAKGLDRADLEVLARALNRTIDWPDDKPS